MQCSRVRCNRDGGRANPLHVYYYTGVRKSSTRACQTQDIGAGAGAGAGEGARAQEGAGEEEGAGAREGAWAVAGEESEAGAE